MSQVRQLALDGEAVEVDHVRTGGNKVKLVMAYYGDLAWREDD
jgi:hypothetical protein